MQKQENPIPIIYSRILLDLLAEHGLHASAILRGTGVELSAVADPEYKLDIKQQNAIYENALSVSKIQGLGLMHGERILPTHLGIVGYAIQTSTNLRQALKLLVRYRPMVGSLVDYQLRTENETTTLAFTNTSVHNSLRRYVLEEHIASIDRILKLITGNRFHATKISFDYPEPSYLPLYGKTFDCPLSFSSSVTEYQFDAKLLNLGLVFADPSTSKACERKCDAIIARISDAGSDVDEIRRVILMLPCDSRNLSAVAAEMNISSRSVRRKLMAEQKTFQGLLDEIRLELATDYLRNTKLTLEDIAPLLGFSDASNFRQAFKKWTGRPPGTFRNKITGG
ncbi:MAG: AraC family transcriptional regulator [Gammaproteobacteria bacterium]|jgi:AraC-like DNA-binding protein|nr:AraC family transcriptional regulator [Gammaproteobacteria bacterium]